MTTETQLLGKKAPAIKLQDQSGEIVNLQDFKGSYVIIFFYPKDMTPGCTTEACSFKDNMAKLTKLGVQILGISCDDVTKHEKFSDKYKLKYPLLADVDKEVVAKYGVWVEKNMYGKKYMGIQRDSFLIDPQGKIVKHYIKVKPAEHVAQVIKDVKELQD
ncbi:MAG: thioredoxin-dependent thiol peroxidase [Cyanobacteria bacterium]|nr:thioredoxin-dependent thiol peroxidase [Cyanobacteriota bacterium]MDA1020121.1 thioredoxin-dependent thiol peroxidase [Cyanobacteriota bacterium]